MDTPPTKEKCNRMELIISIVMESIITLIFFGVVIYVAYKLYTTDSFFDKIRFPIGLVILGALTASRIFVLVKTVEELEKCP